MSKGNDIAGLFSQVQAGVKSVATTALASVSQIVNEVNSLTRKFVEAIRPDVVQRFDLASRDLYAVVGQFLVPVMERATVVVRAMGDTIDGLFKVVKDIIGNGFQVLDGVLKSVIDTVKQVYGVLSAAWLPTLEKMTKIFGDLSPIFTGLLAAFGKAGAVFVELQASIVESLLTALQAAIPDMDGLGKAVVGLMNVVTTPLKLFAASLKVLVDLATPLIKLVAQLGGAVGEVVGELTLLAGDLLSALVDLVKELARAVFTLLDPLKDVVLLLAQGLVGAIRQVVEWVRWAINAFREVIGLPRKQFEKAPGLDGNSTGKAVQRAEFLSPDDLYRKVALSTASLGRTDPVSNIDKTVSTIAATLADMSRAAQQTAANTRPGQPDPRAADMWRRQEINRG